jgi:hypothetical protein
MERDEKGLIKGIEYHFKEDGKVDWKKMLKPEHLGLNKEVFSRRGIDIYKLSEEETNKLKESATDKELIILLSGINYLADLRGYEKVEHVLSPHNSGISCTCHITWEPNFETNNKVKAFSQCAGATPYNTNQLGGKYLDAIAANRAFVRAVRFFLGIQIVAADEVDAADQSIVEEDNNFQPPSPHSTLKSTMSLAKLTFDKVKEKAASKGINVENWNTIDDIPIENCANLIGSIKAALDKKK